MNLAKQFALVGARIFDGYQTHTDKVLLVNQQRIVDIVAADNIPSHYQKVELSGGLLTPGFIDLQINGAGGVQFNNAPTKASLKTMTQAMLPFGVTRILPTLITDTVATTEQAIAAVKQARDEFEGILGIHIEGPFFSDKKNGVHRLEHIRKIADEDWAWLNQLKQFPTLLTLAPEKVSTDNIKNLSQLGIRVCAGHTNAKFHHIDKAVYAGLTGFTHLYNAMRSSSGREPGVVGAALSMPDTWAGIIADGIHVHPTNLQLAIQSKGWEKIFLVSDAMATVGSKNKSFELYGETITEQDGQLKNAEGKLAGSAISVLDAVKYCINTLKLDEEKALAMASRIPAEYMKVADQFGTFKNDCVADITYLSDEYKVIRVWQAGNECNLTAGEL